MATLSPVREAWPLLEGLELVNRGKVRDTYRLKKGLLLVVTTDAISIFDFVLNATVPTKGIILNAMNHFWLKYLAGFGFTTHFVAAGADIDRYLPENLRGNIDLQSRAMVVTELDMVPVEFIFRNCLTGSGLTAYENTGEVCGHKLPAGLQDGDKLPFILDTPTDKAIEGHDEHISAESVRNKYPADTHDLINVVQIARAYLEKRGIMLADTKFEIGSLNFTADDIITTGGPLQAGKIDVRVDILADELLTPDSSRFWDLNEWLESRKPAVGRRACSSFDKELVRIFGKSVGINKLDPKNPADIATVNALVIPDEIIWQTTDVYRYIFWRLTGKTIEQYLYDVLFVQASERRAKKIMIIFGSESDLPEIKRAGIYDNLSGNISMHVISCHRNPQEIMEFVKNLEGVDVVIGVGGKALALPGAIDAWAHYFKNKVRVAGVALGEQGSDALLAAQLSIKEIPGQPVIMDEISGKVYSGAGGLRDLLVRIEKGELPPVRPRKERPVKYNV